MKTLNELKSELLKRVSKKGAYTENYNIGLNATKKSELISVMNGAKTVAPDYLNANFTQEELHRAGIYTSGFHSVSSGICLACGNALVVAHGNSWVEVCDNAYVNDTTGRCVTPSNSAIIRNCRHNKIYVTKGLLYNIN